MGTSGTLTPAIRSMWLSDPKGLISSIPSHLDTKLLRVLEPSRSLAPLRRYCSSALRLSLDRSFSCVSGTELRDRQLLHNWSPIPGDAAAAEHEQANNKGKRKRT